MGKWAREKKTTVGPTTPAPLGPLRNILAPCAPTAVFIVFLLYSLLIQNILKEKQRILGNTIPHPFLTPPTILLMSLEAASGMEGRVRVRGVREGIDAPDRALRRIFLSSFLISFHFISFKIFEIRKKKEKEK